LVNSAKATTTASLLVVIVASSHELPMRKTAAR
jgi:hypothetical protein